MQFKIFIQAYIDCFKTLYLWVKKSGKNPAGYIDSK